MFSSCFVINPLQIQGLRGVDGLPGQPGAPGNVGNMGSPGYPGVPGIKVYAPVSFSHLKSISDCFITNNLAS